MKRVMALCLALLMLVPCAGCTENAEEAKVTVDIPLDKLSWTLKEGTNDGHSHLYFEMTNNSDVAIQSAVMTYKIQDSATQEQKDQFIKALQESQGFSDAFMQDYLKRLEQSGNYLNLTASVTAQLQPGASSQPQLCYYMGGLTTKDLIYIDLFTPAKLTLTYEKDGKTYGQTYDFATKSYTTEEVTDQQQN